MIGVAVGGDLTAEELESLRHAVRQEGVGQGDRVHPLLQEGAASHARRYDFRIPDKFPKDVLRQIAHVHDSMARALTTTFSAKLRATVRVEGVTAEQRTYEEWVRGASDPAILAAFSAEPLNGNALVEIDPVVAFPMLDRLLGGTVDGEIMARPTTDIELTVMQRVLELVLEAWRDAWAQIQPIRPRVLGLETNPLFTQVASPNDIVLNVGMLCGLGRREGRLRLCLPFTMVEPLVQKLAARRWRAEVQERPGSRAPAIRQQLDDVPVPLGVRLATVRLPLEHVLSLSPGTLIPLHVRSESPALVEIRGAVKHTARVGQAEGHLAIQVLDPEGRGQHATR